MNNKHLFGAVSPILFPYPLIITTLATSRRQNLNKLNLFLIEGIG